MSETIKEKILYLLRKGVSYPEITKRTGAHANYVYVVASRHGIKKARRNLQEQIVAYCQKNGIEKTIKKFNTTRERVSTYKNRIKLK